jgi:Uncharacterized alpha/beta hydrolase domain (DUF2235)
VLKPEDLDLFPGLFRCFKRGSDEIVFSDTSKWEELRGWTESGKVAREDGERVAKGGAGADMGRMKCRTRVKTKPVPVQICVEGVWDTVGSLGLPESWFTRCTGFNKMYEFYNTALDNSE